MLLGQTYTFTDGRGTIVYPDAGNGPYTHYIDNTAQNATDTNNPYGTPTLPRKTIPFDLPAGSVLELHGGPYTVANGGGHGSLGGKQCAHALGTASKPVFIRSGDPNNRAVIGADLYPLGSYMIIENLKFHPTNCVFRQDLLPESIDHIALRNCKLYGNGNEPINSSAILGRVWVGHNL